MNVIKLAQDLNKLRDTLTTPEQHDALDDVCGTIADSLSGHMQRMFMDVCLMGE